MLDNRKSDDSPVDVYVCASGLTRCPAHMGFATLEVIALTGSGISLMAIIMLLMAHHDNVVLSWPVSISSIVSIQDTIASLSMVFVVSDCVSQLKWIWFAQRVRKLRNLKTIDRASRGVSGAMILERSRNVCVWHLFCMFMSFIIAD